MERLRRAFKRVSFIALRMSREKSIQIELLKEYLTRICIHSEKLGWVESGDEFEFTIHPQEIYRKVENESV